MRKTGEMQLIMEDWRKFLNEDSAPSAPTVAHFLAIMAKHKGQPLGNATKILVKWSASLGVGIGIGALATWLTGGAGVAHGAAAGTAASAVTADGIQRLYNKIENESGNIAKKLVKMAGMPDGQRGPLDHYFDLDDEYENLLQGMNSELGKKFNKKLYDHWSEVFNDIPDPSVPLDQFLTTNANILFRKFLKKRNQSGVGVRVGKTSDEEIRDQS